MLHPKAQRVFPAKENLQFLETQERQEKLKVPAKPKESYKDNNKKRDRPNHGNKPNKKGKKHCDLCAKNNGPANTLAGNVGDMSATCRPDTVMSANFGRHGMSARHTRGPDIPNSYQLQPTNTSQLKRTSTIATIEFLCLSSNNNHEITDMSGIPRHVGKCRVVSTLWPTRHSLVSAT